MTIRTITITTDSLHEATRNRFLSMLAPLIIRCPRCLANPGQDCRSRTGSRGGFHKPRLTALATLGDEGKQLAMLLTYARKEASPGNIWFNRAAVLAEVIREDEKTAARVEVIQSLRGA
jgi:hypothetical protein